jgi:Xaa-Pro dipeptidase
MAGGRERASLTPPRERESWQDLFRDHISRISRMAEKALAVSAEVGSAEFGGIVLHSGRRALYHADDQEIPFRSLPHFARFAPVAGPDHLLLFRPGEPVQLGMVAPPDYWQEAPPVPDHPFAEVLEVLQAPGIEAVALLLGDVSDCAFIGQSADVAERLGIAARAVEPRSLTAPLDWYRAFKTSYEMECIREAARRAGRGHAAAREGALAGDSEYEIHAAYLAATDQLECETPYPNIIAWDDRSAVLHYQRKRRTPPEPGQSFLIDAGASCYGYASDITRTYVRKGVHDVFREALDRMERLQQQLISQLAASTSYVDLHASAVRGVGEILRELGVLRVSADEIHESRLTSPFLPHGLGHHLGLQVHDVGGQQIAREGELQLPPQEYESLRTTRDLDVGHVVTVEPGLYFIPLLLDRYRRGAESRAFDWKLIDELTACGGIRIEDDLLITESGCENLSRPWVPGHAAISN